MYRREDKRSYPDCQMHLCTLYLSTLILGYDLLQGTTERELFSGLQLPSFEEYCEWVKNTPLITNIELKTSIVYYKDIEEKTAEMVKAFHLEDRVIFSSFNHLSVVRMKQLLPECPVGALVEHDDLQNAGYYCRKYGFEYYHPDGSLFTKENAENCREHGVGVNVWTVNDLKMYEDMREWGVDGVITNYPKYLAELS